MNLDQPTVHWHDRYRATRHTYAGQMGREIADVASDIDDPVAKLRFLREVVEHDSVPRTLHYRVFRPLRRALLRCWGVVCHFSGSARDWLKRVIGRVLMLTGCVSVAIAVGANTYKPLSASISPTPPIEKIAVAAPAASAQSPVERTAAVEPTPEPIAETLPVDTLGITPSTIWMADRGENWELYSNGLRIETSYQVNGEPRTFRVLDLQKGLSDRVQNKPVGILFHTSESDIWELDASFTKQLRQSSEGLLRYVREQRAYNYVIDRFGRVYRIVDDETRANHAGNSIWAHNRDIYLDLNNSFLGVSFESRWAGGKKMPITRAQLIAGRNLTHYLRQRFAIAPEMCVTHGLTSVSPKLYLIGYHLDWARGFPFAAFGLPDQYAVLPPSIKLFGFSYSDSLVRTVGDGWPGALFAETALAHEAVEAGMTVDALRAQRRAIYAKWHAEIRRTNAADRSSDNRTDASAALPSPKDHSQQRG